MKQLLSFSRCLTRRKAFESILLWLCLLVLLYGISSHLVPDAKNLISAVFGVLALIFLVVIGGFSSRTADSIARHLNRHFSGLEYSTHLLLKEDQLNPLEVLQKRRAEQILAQTSLDEFKKTLPPFKYKTALLVMLLAIPFYLPWTTTDEAIAERGSQQLPLQLIETVVDIDMPAYMDLASQSVTDLDLETWSGAKIKWQMTFNQISDEIQLVLSDGEILQPTWNENRATFETTVERSQSYYLRHKGEVFNQSIYSLLVLQDRPPTVRFQGQQESSISFAKNQTPIINIDLNAKDDFGLNDMNVKMSLARGSGEAVKFRDIEKEIEGFSPENGKDQKLLLDWNLTELGMEPGDELYLSVSAWDNKPQQAQSGKSPSLIIKWLDEEPPQIAAEGIVMDVPMEYFKSQRQIIIETRQLIEDSKELSESEIYETSRALGLAQSDLKQRYGQYLGDEFEDSPGPITSASNHDVHQDGHTHESDGSEEDGERTVAFGVYEELVALFEEQHQQSDEVQRYLAQAQQEFYSGSHDHEHAAGDHRQDNDMSGRMDLINRFGHNHGDADIGPVIKHNPKAYMKQSVEQMWSAELHLMLGDPEKALPFEEEALKYLNLARQADRIYIKRLGFEPPPVSEDRRLTGKRDEIVNPTQEAVFQLDDESQEILNSGYRLVMSGYGAINSQETVQLNRILDWVREEVENRPVLIRSQVQLETLLANQSWQPDNCQDCQQQLAQKFWQLLSHTDAEAFHHGRPYLRNELEQGQ